MKYNEQVYECVITEYIRSKEAPEVEYGSRLSNGNRNNYEDSSDQASQGNFRYFKNFQNFNDAGGYSSDIVTSLLPRTTHDGKFEYKVFKWNMVNLRKIPMIYQNRLVLKG